MKYRRWIWLAVFIFYGIVILLWHDWLKRSGMPFLGIQLSYGIGYGLLCLLGIGLFARFRLSIYPGFWRILALAVSVGVAALDIKLQEYPGPLFGPLWASAILGAALVSMASRVAPQSLLNKWYGKESKVETD